MLLLGHSVHTESLTVSTYMIPKPNTDDTTWSNYRLISMPNLDIKLLAKVLASHVNLFIGTLIHKDQTGFIPSHQAGDNIKRATLLAYTTCTRHIPSCFISLDIRKAFDTLSWPYLHSILALGVWLTLFTMGLSPIPNPQGICILLRVSLRPFPH